MEEKKKGNGGLIILIVILLLVCVGMGCFIFNVEYYVLVAMGK